jgi:hypothetical protein
MIAPNHVYVKVQHNSGTLASGLIAFLMAACPNGWASLVSLEFAPD